MGWRGGRGLIAAGVVVFAVVLAAAEAAVKGAHLRWSGWLVAGVLAALAGVAAAVNPVRDVVMAAWAGAIQRGLDRRERARELVGQANNEIEAGHFARAHELLRQATQVQIAAAQAARQLREQAQAVEDAQMSGAASSTATEGGVALTERHYTQAAELFGQAAAYVPPGHLDERLGYLDRQADALQRQGDERGGT